MTVSPPACWPPRDVLRLFRVLSCQPCTASASRRSASILSCCRTHVRALPYSCRTGEKLVGRGLAGVLGMLNEKGALKEQVEWSGRNNDKSKNATQVGGWGCGVRGWGCGVRAWGTA